MISLSLTWPSFVLLFVDFHFYSSRCNWSKLFVRLCVEYYASHQFLFLRKDNKTFDTLQSGISSVVNAIFSRVREVKQNYNCNIWEINSALCKIPGEQDSFSNKSLESGKLCTLLFTYALNICRHIRKHLMYQFSTGIWQWADMFTNRYIKRRCELVWCRFSSLK